MEEVERVLVLMYEVYFFLNIVVYNIFIIGYGKIFNMDVVERVF